MKLKKFLKTVKAICASAGDCTGGKCPFVEKHKNYFDCVIGQDGVPEKWDIKKIMKAAKRLKQKKKGGSYE